MRSMTGFGRTTAADGALEVSCELRSVNHRGLDVRLRLPQGLTTLEPILAATLRERFARGRIEATFALRVGAPGAGRVCLDIDEAHRLVSALRAFAVAEGLSPELRAGELLLRPELFTVEEPRTVGPAQRTLVERALAAAMDDLDQSRAREGQGLWRDLEERLGRCQALVGELAERTAGTPARLQERLNQRLAELDLGSVAPERIAQEVALLAERADVSEELARLGVHLEHFRGLCVSGAAVGRKLDFLCQELHREANTVGSKGADAQLAHLVVELKADIERLREQVQNVE